ncbi:uncharacterized protein DUF4062 [Litorimonas taeanensis]|uniref:Uncharacterized protein DUF4062 n=1 Tax=Litorimonas taeanensis TaxID=568099 RepID=A0A420WF27_9PROT|nr:DUF4062 domain-containing protein [Litorimonas taeanensis]RKQ69583.1 uncharacterized protein DUF4062 [Litorimonas taeanensis]
MNKKYQVFISSTYVDLRQERQHVIQALLELDCIPSGMELFPAADEDQWSLIKSIIDECDYYILIVGGRYGSTNVEGISYTEMEYNYALSTGKPIIAFLHKDPSKIEVGKSESDVEGQKRLESFRSLVQKKMCKFWASPEELGSVVSRSLINLQRKSPGVGWVRGDLVSDKEASQEILKLSKKVEELERQLNKARTQAPSGTEKLAQGDDKFELQTYFSTGSIFEGNQQEWMEKIQMTWSELFFAISPSMINECVEAKLKNRLSSAAREVLLTKLAEYEHLKEEAIDKFFLKETDFETIVIQFRALGLIKKSEKNRSVKDSMTYWTLTPYGNEVMNRLRAIPKS